VRRRRPIDQALFAVVTEAYGHGVSTAMWTIWSPRWAPTLGSPRATYPPERGDLDVEVGADPVGGVQEQVGEGEFGQRAGRCEARIGGDRRDSRVAAQAVVVATGVSADDRGEVLGFDVGDSESGAFWTGFLRP
jgi:putative transposase